KKPATPPVVKTEPQPTTPVVHTPSPVVMPKVQIQRIPFYQSARLFPVKPTIPVAKKVKPVTYKISLEPEPEPAPTPQPKSQPVAATKPAPHRTFPIMPSRVVTPPPGEKVAAPARTSKPEEMPSFSVDVEESKETTLEIYFTDGKGMFFRSTPELQLV